MIGKCLNKDLSSCFGMLKKPPILPQLGNKLPPINLFAPAAPQQNEKTIELPSFQGNRSKDQELNAGLDLFVDN